jgi:HSP20 family molecular chaperone IbpA
MSATATKNILLSQPKIGSIPESQLQTLVHTTTQNELETVVTVEIPGVDPSTVEVTCENNIVTVRCARGEVLIPVNPISDTSKIEADILWGVLTLRVPLPPAPVAHSIKVNMLDTMKKSHTKTATEHFTEKE